MRFITEFERQYPYTLSEIEQDKMRHAEYIGRLFSEQFRWEEKGITNADTCSPAKCLHKLEIEAFPMDKWVEFKKQILFELQKTFVNETAIFHLIKELESFGKPAGEVK